MIVPAVNVRNNFRRMAGESPENDPELTSERNCPADLTRFVRKANVDGSFHAARDSVNMEATVQFVAPPSIRNEIPSSKSAVLSTRFGS